ncbi:hypothetical protein AZF37_00935 [endosymbiont 'TC1' of Trimyema compressum]|uniref:sigma-70 family RNA polymerase sigma factor n=1 Tax=endosymbiont 'TC1' of Trimyema compressum TaxID=243899 RepID=UPI0007F0D96B|nr:sigma-70 family RNA polymerase sigma factor [endosymbiont 'TC1' of Trimyema compressum]AMP19934.1 hypothetical protein AZF37_00935 [endosymbiont 'TC1' of Trimyema compressum]
MKKEKQIEKAIRGNKAALEELLIHMQEQLYRTAYIYMNNKEDALDVVQETACKVVESIKSLKEIRYFKTCVIRILINTAYTELRKRKNVVSLEAVYQLKSSNEMEATVIERLELNSQLKNLKTKYKTVILLYYYHDLSIKEIAFTMDIPEGTVKTYLARGKEQLKINIRKEEEYEKCYNRKLIVLKCQKKLQ